MLCLMHRKPFCVVIPNREVAAIYNAKFKPVLFPSSVRLHDTKQDTCCHGWVKEPPVHWCVSSTLKFLFVCVFVRAAMRYHILVVAEAKRFGLGTASLYFNLSGDFKETGKTEIARGELETTLEVSIHLLCCW